MTQFTVTYSPTLTHRPANAIQTEITAYMWPGFLAELRHDTNELVIYEVGDVWTVRDDMITPPMSCMSVTTSSVWLWEQEGALLTQWPQVQRRLQPMHTIRADNPQKVSLS